MRRSFLSCQPVEEFVASAASGEYPVEFLGHFSGGGGLLEYRRVGAPHVPRPERAAVSQKRIFRGKLSESFNAAVYGAVVYHAVCVLCGGVERFELYIRGGQRVFVDLEVVGGENVFSSRQLYHL